MKNKIGNSHNVLNMLPGTPKALISVYWFITIIANCQYGKSKWPYAIF